MRDPVLVCANCGSESVRRSKRQSLSEVPRMALGIYPFRCMTCSARFHASVWLLSRLPYAKCPKCFGRELTIWPAKLFAPGLWNRVATMLGAQRYRCPSCRKHFVSFRPRAIAAENRSQPINVAESPAGNRL